MTSPTAEPGDTAGRKAKAQRDALVELVAIFVHDLSNPLQSLTVLCELALDEALAGSDAQLRARQSLEAAERMRLLIHGLAGVTRHVEGPPHISAVVKRVSDVLARRLERHNIDATVDTSPIDRVVPPPAVELALLNLGLGAVAAAASARVPRFELSILGTREGTRDSGQTQPTRCAVVVTLTACPHDGSRQPLALPDDHRTRVAALIENEPSVRLHIDEISSRLHFDAVGAA